MGPKGEPDTKTNLSTDRRPQHKCTNQELRSTQHVLPCRIHNIHRGYSGTSRCPGFLVNIMFYYAWNLVSCITHYVLQVSKVGGGVILLYFIFIAFRDLVSASKTENVSSFYGGRWAWMEPSSCVSCDEDIYVFLKRKSRLNILWFPYWLFQACKTSVLV
jgi:hypothetical protein